MKLRLYFRELARESRGARGRLAFFVLCLSVGVAAVSAVAGLSSSLDDGIRVEARQLLAADLSIHGSKPLPSDFDLSVAGLSGLRSTAVKETVTVVAAPPGPHGEPGPSQLVEVKAVAGEYPFYGNLVLRPARPLSHL